MARDGIPGDLVININSSVPLRTAIEIHVLLFCFFHRDAFGNLYVDHERFQENEPLIIALILLNINK